MFNLFSKITEHRINGTFWDNPLHPHAPPPPSDEARPHFCNMVANKRENWTSQQQRTSKLFSFEYLVTSFDF